MQTQQPHAVRKAKPAPLIPYLRSLFGYRELLVNLIRRELKVRYKNSSLGFLWSMLNPLLYLVIFSVVIGIFLGRGVPWFHFFLLSGLLAWNLLSAGLMGATGSIIGNASLVTKIYFPREILPLSAIGAALFNFVLQMGVLMAAMAVTTYVRFWNQGMLLLLFALLVEVIFLVGLSFIVASLNVFFRDVQYLLELILLAWFWMTPIVYGIATIQPRLQKIPVLWTIYLLNPMTAISMGFQRALYSQVSPKAAGGQAVSVLIDKPIGWYFLRLGYVGAASLVLLMIGWSVFRKLQSRLAEEL
ncbi:MAG: ABC transporter permease [Actinomycetota bacterium]|nr:ABC transporter permease [Actinomycetota bacterium]